MPRILIVEDELSLQDDLATFLDAKGYATACAGTLAEAQQHIRTSTFDVIVLDLGLPDGHGVQLLTEIRARTGLQSGVVILTAHQDLDDKLGALEAGSDAYLVKHASLREIEFTIRNVLKRLPNASNGPKTGWALERKNRLLVPPEGESVPLTPKELTFLLLLAEAGPDVCDHTRLTEEMGSSTDANSSNLTAMVRRLRQKVTEKTGREPPIRAVYGRGYSFFEQISLT